MSSSKKSDGAIAENVEEKNENQSRKRRSSMSTRASKIKRASSVQEDVTNQSVENTDTINSTNTSENLKWKFGVIGLGIMGSNIVKHLLRTGYKVSVWNRSEEKSLAMKNLGAVVSETPGDVVLASDITFCCVSDQKAAKEMFFGNCGVCDHITESKSYIEMSNIDSETSKEIAGKVFSKGGRFLEVRLQGSRKEAEEGRLTLLAAGDKDLYNDCEACFATFAKYSKFVGEVGVASMTNTVIDLISGIISTGSAEAMALAESAGVKGSTVLKILESSNLNSPLIIEKCDAINKNNFTEVNKALIHVYNNIKNAAVLANKTDAMFRLGATTFGILIEAKRKGYPLHDSSAVYYGIKS